MKMPVTAVLNTLNEAKNIGNALASLTDWCDQIIVVDMYSDDLTREIAIKHGAEVYLHDRLGYADPAREFAVSKSRNGWIIMLDADEMITLPLRKRLIHILLSDSADVVVMPWRNYLLGRHIAFTGWGGEDDKHARFFKKEFMNISGEVHNFLRPKAEARILVLENILDNQVFHFNYLDSHQFISKMNNYTNKESENIRHKSVRFILFYIFTRPAKEFLWRFIVKRSYKDGWQGLTLTIFMSFYKFLVGVKALEYKTNGDSDEVRKNYQSISCILVKEMRNEAESDSSNSQL